MRVVKQARRVLKSLFKLRERVISSCLLGRLLKMHLPLSSNNKSKTKIKRQDNLKVQLILPRNFHF